MNLIKHNDMKRNMTYKIAALLFFSLPWASVGVCAQSAASFQSPQKQKVQKREAYEWEGEIPTYVEQLKQELTYPMAWGNSPIKNFSKWKKMARDKVFECMMTPPKAATSWDMQVLEEEQQIGRASCRERV